MAQGTDCKFLQGTYAFMSSRLLQDASWRYFLRDDLESACWVLIYSTLSQFRTTKTLDEQVDLFRKLFYDDYRYNQRVERVEGGVNKDNSLSKGYKTLRFDGQPGLNSLVQGIGSLFSPFYSQGTEEDTPTFPGSEDSRTLINLFEKALAKPADWPDVESTEEIGFYVKVRGYRRTVSHFFLHSVV
jgi:hypothetical protein